MDRAGFLRALSEHVALWSYVGVVGVIHCNASMLALCTVLALTSHLRAFGQFFCQIFKLFNVLSSICDTLIFKQRRKCTTYVVLHILHIVLHTVSVIIIHHFLIVGRQRQGWWLEVGGHLALIITQIMESQIRLVSAVYQYTHLKNHTQVSGRVPPCLLLLHSIKKCCLIMTDIVDHMISPQSSKKASFQTTILFTFSEVVMAMNEH